MHNTNKPNHTTTTLVTIIGMLFGMLPSEQAYYLGVTMAVWAAKQASTPITMVTRDIVDCWPHIDDPWEKPCKQ